MNPDRIWRELGNLALAEQITADKYGIFVAMPFRNQFSYRSDDVFTRVIERAVERANAQQPFRPFTCPPVRSDKLAPNASEITEEIVEHIIGDHFFIADLTLANQGVLIEVGVALAMKTPRQIVLIHQGDMRDLHFDIKDNRVISYDHGDPTDEIARALVDGAKVFESGVGIRMQTIRESLSPKAVYLLNRYGRLRLENPAASLHTGIIQEDSNLSPDPTVRMMIFTSAIQELLQRGLVKLDYKAADDGINPDEYGLHATKLGLVFIRKTWPRMLGAVK
jgi:hypothetical protein